MAEKPKRALSALFAWIADKAIEYWPQLVSALVAGGGMTYLAAASEFLRPYGPFIWGAIGLVSMVLMASIFWLYAAARQRSMLVTYAKRLAERTTTNVLAPVHHRETMRLVDFYHPYFRPTEHVRFEECEFAGPAFVVIDGCNFHEPLWVDCEFVIVRNDRPIKGAMRFSFCTFVRSRFYRVTWVVNMDTYLAFPDHLRAGVPVISDGRIGDV